jgi:hypothetical protein
MSLMTLAIAIAALLFMIIVTIPLIAGPLADLGQRAGSDNRPALRLAAVWE